MQTKKITSSI